MEKRTKALIILVTLTIIFTIIGGTLAYFRWSSSGEQNTLVTFTVSSGFSCSADGGGSINNNNGTLAPASCTNSTYAFQRTIKANVINNRDGNIYLDMWLNVNSIDSGLANSENFKYALTTNASSCTQDVVSEGTFKGTSAGSKVPILDGKSYAATTNNDTFYLYVWLDSAETSSSTMNQNFSLSLGGECSDNAKPNKPVLDTGMIPVKISDTGVVTAVAETDPTWYDYDNQEWANAVLVKENGIKTRNANKNDLTTINQSDILAYFVWIPRYSYNVWQYSGVTSPAQEREINIKFVKKTDTKEVATQNGEWYTHPAFTFGTTELEGIWVGKFETSTDSSSTCYGLPSSDNCDNTNQSPKILPGVDSLRYQTVSNQFQTSLKFAGGSMTNNVISFAGSATYGLTTATNSHMMKNSEWGAAVYLSHSKYGINTEVRGNNYRENSSNYYRRSTGCGADPSAWSTSTTCAIPYGTPSDETYTYPQSTTGNISGIFDMSGGAEEYVMGNYAKSTKSSGFESSWFTSNGKYYNLYASNVFNGEYSTNMALCTLATCGGHALNETDYWYNDYQTFVISYQTWFSRGYYDAGSHTGMFAYEYSTGASSYYRTFRVVLANVGN